MSFHVALDLAFTAAVHDPGVFDEFLDRVMDELAAINVEADLVASLAKYEATFLLPATDMSADALVEALTNLRTALHAAGCGTSGWPTNHTVLRAEPRKDLAAA